MKRLYLKRIKDSSFFGVDIKKMCPIYIINPYHGNGIIKHDSEYCNVYKLDQFSHFLEDNSLYHFEEPVEYYILKEK